jgi:hypothetical protein
MTYLKKKIFCMQKQLDFLVRKVREDEARMTGRDCAVLVQLYRAYRNDFLR